MIPDRHPKLQLAAESVTSILQSNRPDEIISSELAELIGFEDIDLVMGLIHNRSKLVEHLAVRLSFFWTPAYPDIANRNRNRIVLQSGQLSTAILLWTSVRKPLVREWRTH